MINGGDGDKLLGARTLIGQFVIADPLTRQTSCLIELDVIGLADARPVVPVAVRVRHE